MNLDGANWEKYFSALGVKKNPAWDDKFLGWYGLRSYNFAFGARNTQEATLTEG